MPFDSTNMPLAPIAWSAQAQRIVRRAPPCPERYSALLRPGPANLKRLYSRQYFKQHKPRPVIAIAVPLGIAATFLLGSVLGWLG
jgi:hypothetical protein